MPNKIRNIILIALFIGVLAVVMISGYDPSIKEETPPVTATQAGLDRKVPVVGIIVEPQKFEESVSGTGIIEAWNRTQLASETGGRLIKWNADLGEWLNKGAVLVELDGEIAKLQADQTEAAHQTAIIAFEKAEKDFERQKALKEKGDIGESAFEAAEIAFKHAKASLLGANAANGLAKRAFEETRIKMPFGGRLSARYAVVGQSLAPGMPVAEIVQSEPMRLEVGFSETEIVNIKVGQSAVITSTGWGDRKFRGVVHAVGTAAGSMDRLFPVIIRLSSFDNEIKAGMAASASILTKTFEDVVVLPREAVLPEKGKYFTYKVEGNRAFKKDVQIQAQNSIHTQIISGIAFGDTVITAGMASLRDSQKIDLTLE
ncbi:efflux RND transporter periplasmic adaptor subunit [Calditrichota bacterium]